jgi:hypothetical protein
MPPLCPQELDSGHSSSLNDDSSGSCTPSTKGPKKSVRFSTDVSYDRDTAERGTGPAPPSAAKGRGGGDGDSAHSPASGVDDGGDDAAGGRLGAAGSAADPHIKAADEDAIIGAEGHGLLPSWRLKMPVVEWCVIASHARMKETNLSAALKAVPQTLCHDPYQQRRLRVHKQCTASQQWRAAKQV